MTRTDQSGVCDLIGDRVTSEPERDELCVSYMPALALRQEPLHPKPVMGGI